MTATDTGLCDGCETESFDVETCEHGHTHCADCRAELRCRYCRTAGRTRTWRLA